MLQQTTVTKTFFAVIAALGWFALVSQFYININSNAASHAEIVIRYFSYFTILTNLIVAICCTVIALGFSLQKFFLRSSTVTAITVYITVVGAVYNAVLRFLWKPQGLQFIVDELLHTIIPIAFLVYWFSAVPKKNLTWMDAFKWLAFPFVYSIYILIRGLLSGFYPYPFINVNQLGINKALANACILMLLFLLCSLLFIAIGKLLNRNKAN